jgi:hypothetical protein
MTQDEIMKMAREAGLHIATDVNWMPIVGLEYAERFAKLVAEHEREACANVAEEGLIGHTIAKAIRARGQA